MNTRRLIQQRPDLLTESELELAEAHKVKRGRGGTYALKAR